MGMQRYAAIICPDSGLGGYRVARNTNRARQWRALFRASESEDGWRSQMRAARLGAGYSPVLDSAATGHDWPGGEPDSPAILSRAGSAVSGAVSRKRQFGHAAINDALSKAQCCNARSTHIAELPVPR